MYEDDGIERWRRGERRWYPGERAAAVSQSVIRILQKVLFNAQYINNINAARQQIYLNYFCKGFLIFKKWP